MTKLSWVGAPCDQLVSYAASLISCCLVDWPEEIATSSASKAAWLIAAMLERRAVVRAVAEGVLGMGVVSWKLHASWSMWWASSEPGKWNSPTCHSRSKGFNHLIHISCFLSLETETLYFPPENRSSQEKRIVLCLSPSSL